MPPTHKARSITLTLPLDERSYDTRNAFWQIIHHQAPKTERWDSQHTLLFDDIRKKTKEHVLAVPKGQFLSLPHFIDQSTLEEIKDFFRSIAHFAQDAGLTETGYRVIANHGFIHDNHAHQEIPHFHAHIAGGERLGKSVALMGGDMTMAKVSFAEHTCPHMFVQEALRHQMAEHTIGSYKMIAYKMRDHHITLIGFLCLNDAEHSVYPSFQAFASEADAEVLMLSFRFITSVAKIAGLHHTGYRLIINHGRDAGQYPQNILHFMIAGGAWLNATVTDAEGQLYFMTHPCRC